MARRGERTLIVEVMSLTGEGPLERPTGLDKASSKIIVVNCTKSGGRVSNIVCEDSKETSTEQ